MILYSIFVSFVYGVNINLFLQLPSAIYFAVCHSDLHGSMVFQLGGDYIFVSFACFLRSATYFVVCDLLCKTGYRSEANSVYGPRVRVDSPMRLCVAPVNQEHAETLTCYHY